MPGALDPFLPAYDVREQFQLRVAAPPELVYQVAAGFDLDSVPLVHAIFAMRARLMAAGPAPASPFRSGLITGAREIGWGTLVETPGRLFVAGAYCRPWEANVTFHPLSAGTFRGFGNPEQVKIAWTIETLGEGAEAVPPRHRDASPGHERRGSAPFPEVLALGPLRDLLDPLAPAAGDPPHR